MKKSILICVVSVFALTGCMTVSYKPQVSLPESPRTIKAKVRIETLVDKSPEEDKSDAIMGGSATAVGTLSGELGAEVTDSLIADFNSNQVFEVIKKRMDDPDIILKGTINRFQGKAGFNALGVITIPVNLIWLFGLPVGIEEGFVDLTLEAYRTDGTLLGKYNGKSSYEENYNIYSNKILNISSRTNKCFSDVVRQIRDAMLADENILLSRQVSQLK